MLILVRYVLVLQVTVTLDKRDSSVSQMLKDLEWDTLETRRERNRLAMLYKIQNSLVVINKES